jgi:hypothetical protein
MMRTTGRLMGTLAVLLAGAMAVWAAQDQPRPAQPTTVTLVIEGMT